MKRLFLLFALLTQAGCVSHGERALNILFIGNSLTFVNNLPMSLKAIAAAEGHTLNVTMQAPGGWTLAQHDADPTTNALIKKGGWDYVVLQEQSSTSVNAKDYFLTAAASLNMKIKSAGARTLLYQNWALNTEPNRYNEYHDIFATAAERLSAIRVPAGDAWWKLYQEYPNVWSSLYADDRHPTPKGTYLTACVFYAVLYGQAPTKPDPVLGLSAQDSAYFQARAMDALKAKEAVAP